MSEKNKPVWLLGVIMIWYALLFVGAGLIALMGMAFGSEVYRNDPIPMTEMAIIYGPVVVVALLATGTIALWTKDQINAAIGLWIASIAILVVAVLGGGLLGI